jgi:hypothetical protein
MTPPDSDAVILRCARCNCPLVPGGEHFCGIGPVDSSPHVHGARCSDPKCERCVAARLRESGPVVLSKSLAQRILAALEEQIRKSTRSEPELHAVRAELRAVIGK